MDVRSAFSNVQCVLTICYCVQVPAVATPTVPDASVASSASHPVETSSETRSWEKPWSTGVVRQNAKQWSLAGDTAVSYFSHFIDTY